MPSTPPRLAKAPIWAGWPWAALSVLVLTVVIGIIGWNQINPTSRVSVETRGDTTISKNQIRAALAPDGHETKAYAPFTIRVCAEPERTACSNPPRPVVGLRMKKDYSLVSVSERWLKVPEGGEDGPRHPSARSMISNAVSTAQEAGQEAGQVSAAVHATVEAQSLHVSRSPLLWGALVAIGLLASTYLGFTHRRNRVFARKQAAQFSRATRQLATVMWQLESAELSATQLESTGGSVRADELRLRQRSLLPRAVKLTKTQRDLETKAPGVVPHGGAARPQQFDEFADEVERLLLDTQSVTQGATLLTHSASAVDVWDAEAAPLLNAASIVDSMLERSGFKDRPGVPGALKDLGKVRDRVLTLGAERAKREDSTAEVASKDLDVLVEETLAVSKVMQRLLNGALKPRAYRLEDKDLPRDLANLTAVDGVRLRSKVGMLRRPLVASRISSMLDTEEVPLTAEGLRSWWEDSAKDRNVADRDRQKRHDRSARQREKSQRLKNMTPTQRKLYKRREALQGFSWAMGCVVVLCLGIWAVGSIITTTVDRFSQSNAKHHLRVVAMPTGNGWLTTSEMNARLQDAGAYVPARVAVIQLPYAPAANTIDEDHPNYVNKSDRISAALATRALVQEQMPELYDEKTGDLRRDAVVVAVRPDSETSDARFSTVSWIWGPTAGSERDRGISAPSPSGYVSDSSMLSRTIASTLSRQFAESFGKPVWLAAPATTSLIGVGVVGLGVGGVTLVVWLRGKPWEALGANGRRRRASDAALAAATAALTAAYSREDEAELDALMAAHAAEGEPTSGTAADAAASVSAERQRVQTRTRALALRRAEELAALPASERSTTEHQGRVNALSDAVAGLESERDDIAEQAQRYVDSLLS